MITQGERDRRVKELEAVLSAQRGKPDYKLLFELTLYHLNTVSGSRNNFSPEINEVFFKRVQEGPPVPLRSQFVETMQMEGAEFLAAMRQVGLSPY